MTRRILKLFSILFIWSIWGIFPPTEYASGNNSDYKYGKLEDFLTNLKKICQDGTGFVYYFKYIM